MESVENQWMLNAFEYSTKPIWICENGEEFRGEEEQRSTLTISIESVLIHFSIVNHNNNNNNDKNMKFPHRSGTNWTKNRHNWKWLTNSIFVQLHCQSKIDISYKRDRIVKKHMI